MSRGSKRGGSGKLANRLALVMGAAGAVAAMLAVAIVAVTMSSGITSQYQSVVTKGWVLGMALAAIGGIVVGVVAFQQGSSLASRLTELGLGIAKIGRGGAEVRIRTAGDDEVTKVGRAVQYLASDIAALTAESEAGGGLGANLDPQVRGIRDLQLPDDLPEVEGFELDGVLSPGSRGGLEYFDASTDGGAAVLFLVAPEGVGAASAIAVRMARDEIVRALKAGAAARKALSHTNRVLHKQLPKGSCATACLIELAEDSVKLYQAGFRSPLLVSRAGQVEDVNAEGLALGLDAGPVFEKGLRSTSIPVAQGVRLVLANEAAQRLDGFVDQIAQHAPKHTAPFMNLVLGALEGDAGEGGLREDVILLTAKRW